MQGGVFDWQREVRYFFRSLLESNFERQYILRDFFTLEKKVGKKRKTGREGQLGKEDIQVREIFERKRIL